MSEFLGTCVKSSLLPALSQLDCKHPSRPDDMRPTISSTFNSRGHVGLINMTAYTHGPYIWTLHYQVHHDKMS
jgi:hypothetical protein